MSHINKKKEWQDYAKVWGYFQSPWVPSSERIRIYGKLIKKYSKGREALLLGATPAIRDLLAKLKFRVTVVDISPLMIKAMSSLRKMKSREKVIIANWLTIRLNKKFDLIIGDTVINNLHPKEYVRFFRRIRNFLQDDGVFINQSVVLTKHVNKIKITIDKIIGKLKKDPKYYENYLNSAYDYLEWSCGHAKNHLIDWSTLEREYQKRLEKSEISPAEFRLLSSGFKTLRISFYPEKKLEKIMSKYWRIIEKRHEKNHQVHRDFYRIYVLKKR